MRKTKVVEVLEWHIQSQRNQRCICGWRPDYSDRSSGQLFPEYKQHREHVADMLEGAGLLK